MSGFVVAAGTSLGGRTSPRRVRIVLANGFESKEVQGTFTAFDALERKEPVPLLAIQIAHLPDSAEESTVLSRTRVIKVAIAFPAAHSLEAKASPQRPARKESGRHDPLGSPETGRGYNWQGSERN